MTSRRAWVQTALGAAVFPALRPTLESSVGRDLVAPGREAPSLDASDDEAFWAQVRDNFEHTPNQTNLVTVVRGVTTRATRDAIGAETERLNAFRPRPAAASDPQWKDRVRGKVATFLNAPKSQVALVRNTTEGVTTVLLNWPLRRGDEILCTATEHGPFYGTLAYRAARDGITVRPVRVAMPATSPQEIVDAFARAMTARTRLVLLPQVVLYGQIMPVRAITDLAHARGARVLVDGVLSVGHIAVDVTAMDCDFFAAGFHKGGCGPRGTAAFISKPEVVEELAPLFGQGIPSLDLPTTDNDGSPLKVPRWQSPAMTKFEATGGPPDAHYYALENAIDFLAAIGAERIQRRLFDLTRRWATRASALSGFRSAVTIAPEHCAGLVGFEWRGKSTNVADYLRANNRILIGGTERYGGVFGIPETAPRGLLGPNMAVFTSPAEVDLFAETLEAYARVS